MFVQDLGLTDYRTAWKIQEAAHAEVVAGGESRLLLVEHSPVITFGRRDGGEKHLLAAPQDLARLGVELVQSDRGGDITFHGPGQLVAYPIVRLNDRGLSVGAYVHGLEQAVIETLAEFGIAGRTDPSAVGVWVDPGSGVLAKVCAIGVRIRRGVSMHGLALNVNTDLRFFELIVPCGLTKRPVTSIAKSLDNSGPTLQTVKEALAQRIVERFRRPIAR